MRAQRVRAVRVADQDLDDLMSCGGGGPQRPRPVVVGDGRAVMEALEPRITRSSDAGEFAFGPIELGAAVSAENELELAHAKPLSEITITERQQVQLVHRPFAEPEHNYVVTYTLLRDEAVYYRHTSDDLLRMPAQWFYFYQGTLDGDATHVARVEVVRDDGARTSSELTIHVVNRPPAIDVTGPDRAAAGQAVRVMVEPAKEWIRPPYTFRYLSEPVEDYSAGLTYRIDWDGDGSMDQAFREPPVADVADPAHAYTTFEYLTHTYMTPGVYTIRVTAEDKDGGVSDVATQTITITPAGESSGAAAGDPVYGWFYLRWDDRSYDGDGDADVGLDSRDGHGGGLLDAISSEGHDEDDLLATPSDDGLVWR